MADEMNPNRLSLRRVLLKGLALFLVIDLLIAPIVPLGWLGKISGYNHIFTSRSRLPYGENPEQAYNFSLYNIDAMIASHELAGMNKNTDEYRVLFIGDSSVWGYLLRPDETIAAYINKSQLILQDGRYVRAFNLGYPTMSLTKDLFILKYAMQYHPDLIVWLLTLESFPKANQLDSPILQNNPLIIQELISDYSLDLNSSDSRFVIPNYWNSTLIGERRPLADLIRLQLYGIMWAATGIDQYYPATYDPPQKDLSDDESFRGLQPSNLAISDLSLDVLYAGKVMAGEIPILFINEPIYLSQGKNSDIRYNFFYPRWAYDQYRQIFADQCQSQSWLCLDEWDLVPPNDFTNSAIHMTPNGTQILATEIGKEILSNLHP